MFTKLAVNLDWHCSYWWGINEN